LLRVYAFANAIGTYVIVLSTSHWFHRRPIGIWAAYKLTLRHYLGSLALASAVTVPSHIIQTLYEFIYQLIRGNTGRGGFLRALEGCCRFCLNYYEIYVRHVDDRALTILSYGDHTYCQSVEHYRQLYRKHGDWIEFADGVGEAFIFVGKLTIATLATVAASYLLTDYVILGGEAHALVLVFLLSYVTAHGFLAIFGASAESILINTLIVKDLGIRFENINLHEDLKSAWNAHGATIQVDVHVSERQGGHY